MYDVWAAVERAAARVVVEREVATTVEARKAEVMEAGTAAMAAVVREVEETAAVMAEAAGGSTRAPALRSPVSLGIFCSPGFFSGGGGRGAGGLTVRC